MTCPQTTPGRLTLLMAHRGGIRARLGTSICIGNTVGWYEGLSSGDQHALRLIESASQSCIGPHVQIVEGVTGTLAAVL